MHAPVPCPTNGSQPCDESGRYQLAPDGSLALGNLLNTYVTESWEMPTGCTARDVDGNPLVHYADNNVNYDEHVLVPTRRPNDLVNASRASCRASSTGRIRPIKEPPTPTSARRSTATTASATGASTEPSTPPIRAAPECVGGSFESLPAADYLVHIAIPDNPGNPGSPMYTTTQEEDINIGRGDQIVPQVPPPACAGALHTVDLAGDGDDSYPQFVGDGTNGVACRRDRSPFDPGGQRHVPRHRRLALRGDATAHVRHQAGGAGQRQVGRADLQRVHRRSGSGAHPHRDPDDLNFSTDRRSIMYGEKAGMAFVPVGIYDFANKLAYTTETDFNGIYDVLMPSTDHISCPTPSGVCANMYYFVANDPGIPGALNPNYTPRFNTMGAGAEAMAGITTFADIAPWQVGLTIEQPGTNVSQNVTCPQDAATPQLFAVDRPYVSGTNRTFTISGLGFGASPGGQVTLDKTVLTTGPWSNTSITATVPANMAVGPHQLRITSSNGQSTVNGLDLPRARHRVQPEPVRGRCAAHACAAGRRRTHAMIQNALDAAYTSAGDDLVVVYPGTPDFANPRNNPWGAYYENLIVASPVKLQGVGPGGFQGSTYVPGSMINAGAYSGDTAAATDWLNKVATYTWDGNQTVNDGEAIYLLASATNGGAGRAVCSPAASRRASTGSTSGAGTRTGSRATSTTSPVGRPVCRRRSRRRAARSSPTPTSVTCRSRTTWCRTTAAGTGRSASATPTSAPDTNQHNENVRIANNRVIANAGTNLAGWRSACSRDRTPTRSSTTTSAATSRRSTAVG